MPRPAKLCKKNGYWYSEAGAPSGKYFGRCDKVKFPDAQGEFRTYVASLKHTRPRADSVSVERLAHLFLDAVKEHRSSRTYDERKLHLDRFTNHLRGELLVGEMSADAINADDLKSFCEATGREHELDAFTVHKHVISIVAAFNWAACVGKLKNPKPALPTGFRPFAQVERFKPAARELLESELPTDDEITAILRCADADLALMKDNGRYRQRRPDEYRRGDDNPYVGFADMIRVYRETGARTSELAVACVRHFNRAARQIVIGDHKRSKTLRNATARRIVLNDTAYAIIAALCKCRKPDDPIFTDPQGRPWNWRRLDHRFEQVRERAKVRDAITIYSFRHRWISVALMAGVDVGAVAKMAGTSIAMVEKVYGHYTNQHFQDAIGRIERHNAKPAAHSAA